MKKAEIISLIIILISFLVGFYFYPRMPELMASHWNAQGEVDGYIAKCGGLFLLPILLVILFFIFILFPRIDPLKKNIEEFRKYFDWFFILIIGFLFYIYLLTIVWNLGVIFEMRYFLLPAFGILFYFAGILIEKAKRNWFIGIRTPWTLSNDVVWEKTHKVGGKLFKILGIISFLGIFFLRFAFLVVIFPAILVSLYLIAYSYFEFQKEVNQKNKKL